MDETVKVKLIQVKAYELENILDMEVEEGDCIEILITKINR